MHKERPILFSAPMVRAILDGRKTQTRRAVKVPPKPPKPHPNNWQVVLDGAVHKVGLCPYGQPGDRLWLRETWQGYRQTNVEYDEWEEMESPKDRHIEPYQPVYKADGKTFPDTWFPSIHMPREYSRVLLEITGVRVERLQDISKDDCYAEGLRNLNNDMAEFEGAYGLVKAIFQKIWEAINGVESWKSNPWVWVIEFKRVQ